MLFCSMQSLKTGPTRYIPLKLNREVSYLTSDADADGAAFLIALPRGLHAPAPVNMLVNVKFPDATVDQQNLVARWL